MNFGASPVAEAGKQAGQSAAREIKQLGIAKQIDKVASNFSSDLQASGLSLEDLTSRAMVVVAIYMPQGLIAIKEDAHKWETNGRNFVIWTGSLALQYMLKSPKFGLNQLLDPFMAPRADKPKGRAERLVNPLRAKMPVDKAATEEASKTVYKSYYDMLEEAGLKITDKDRGKAYWSAIDPNEMNRLIYHHFPGIEKTAEEAGKQAGKSSGLLSGLKGMLPGGAKGASRSGEEKLAISGSNAMRMYVRDALGKGGSTLNEGQKATLKVMSRVWAFKTLSTALYAALLVYLLGDLLMRGVNKYIAPLDHDFVPPPDMKAAKKAKKAARHAEKEAKKAGRPMPAASMQPPASSTAPASGLTPSPQAPVQPPQPSVSLPPVPGHDAPATPVPGAPGDMPPPSALNPVATGPVSSGQPGGQAFAGVKPPVRQTVLGAESPAGQPLGGLNHV